jgi:polyisoprenoid-binding protein YceI
MASATASASAAGSTTAGATASVAIRSPAVSSATAPSGSADASGGPAAVTAEIEGTWTVDESVGSFSDFTSSFVGYRVNETLGTIGATTAVGRTPDVSGSLTVDGTTISAAEMSADLTTLRSDDGRRDGQLRRQAIETDTFPTATFVLTEPIELTGSPAEGEEVSVTATGQFTLHGVTRTVQIPLQARLSSGVVTVVGSLEVLFADYGIEKPRAQIVVDVEDHGVMEFQLHFTRA